MNVLPCQVQGGKAFFAGEAVDAENASAAAGRGRSEIGVRPEFVSIAPAGIPADVVRVSDAGRYRIVETKSHGHTIKLLLKEGESVPEGRTFLAFDPTHTQVYEDGWIAGVRR
jgi:glycerol transport system ATP-binding protein